MRRKEIKTQTVENDFCILKKEEKKTVYYKVHIFM